MLPVFPALPDTAGAFAPAAAWGEDPVGELARRLLGSLARSDQRRSGELYLRGLLAATGRRSIRNIAAQTGVPADAQRLHHFISDSTWSWRPVRRALAHHLGRLAPPRAWVVHTATLPRAGRGGVGADRYADPRTGRTVDAQRAVGLWAVTERGGCPVDWHLQLTPRWLDDPGLRERAALPADATAVDPVAAGLDMVRDTARAAGPHHPPVLLDARHAPAGRVAARLAADGFPYLLRVSAAQPLTPLTADGRDTARTVTAGQLATGPAARPFGRVRPPGPAAGPHEAVRVACRAADTPPGPRRRQLLLARRDPYRPAHTAYWLTDLTTLTTAALVALAAVPAGIAGDVTGTGRRIGLYDFEGRTFAGWHRHITLASAAHAAALLLHDRT
ncbi:IS701-like element ISBj9 family transposase [Streptomyces ziwulingensis]|uniref:IS701-like element ISBj9 family transposase n=1 Tax=Streptomyces ziwulingensis TaxID=1045501 RepID=A0ABP9BVC9_9ACTN